MSGTSKPIIVDPDGVAYIYLPKDMRLLKNLTPDELKSLETEKGFYHALATVVSDVSVTVPVRWQAVLYVKNGIDRYW